MNHPTFPLITTKFAPPRIASQAVLREHLLECLGRAQGSRLVLVSGGAGYGKTTLLAQWRQGLVRDGASVAWLSLAPEDGSLTSFGAHLLGSLRQAGVSLEDGLLSLLANEHEEGARSFASVLINTIARASRRIFLVIDDFHHAAAPHIVTMLQLLIDRAPTNLHLVLASRKTPALLLGRLRGMGEVCEIGCRELSFGYRESLAFLRTTLGDELEPDIAHSAHDLTAGWPLGLQMVANALKGLPGRKAITPSLPDQMGLSDYFAEEVLAPLPAPLIGFLQKLAILQRFNADLAAHVTGSPDAETLLTELRKRNLFLLPVEDQEESQWYCLHPLFAAFLTRSGASTMYFPDLHRRASRWFEDAGRITESVRHAVLCEDLDVLIGLLERAQGEYHNISHLNQYIHWLESVPMERLAQHPSILLTGAWSCLMLVQTRKAEAWLATLEATETTTTWTPHISLTKAVIALQRDDLARCFGLLGALEGRQFTHQPYEHVRSAMYLVCLAYMGLHDKARQYFNAPRTSPLHTSTDETALLFQATGAYAAFLEGDVLEAGRLISEVLHRAEWIHGPGSVSACSCAVLMATVFYESDRVDDARGVIANRLGMLRFSTPSYMIHAALCYARLQCQQEGPQSALKYLARKIAGFRALGVPRGLANMLAEQVRILLGCGDWRQSEGPQKTLDGLAQDHRNLQTPVDAEIVALATLSRARLSLARQEPELALRLVDSAQPIADRYQRGQWQTQMAIMRALALDALGQRDEAMRLLRELLDQACRKGLIRTLLDEGKPLRELLLHLDCQDDAVLESFRLRLANAPLQTAPEASQNTQSAGMTDGLLTRREQEIIGLLEQSMSNKRIAQTLNLSLETVKWYLKNIYAKLGVAGRYEAIVAARQQMDDY